MSALPPSTPTPVPLVHRTRFWVAVFVAGVAACAVAGVVWWSSRPDAARNEAIRAATDGRFGEAEPRLKEVLAHKPDDVEVVEALARGYLKGNKTAEAESSLTRWVELRPEDRDARRLRFEFYRKAKDTEKAYPDGKRLLELEPTDATLRRTLVGMAFSLGRFADAEALCTDALRDQPDERSLRSLLSEIRRARGDIAGAGAVLDQLLKDFPAHTPAMLARGVLFLETGQPEKAVPLLREVVRLDKSRQRTAGYQLAVALERSGDVAEAQKVTAELRRIQDVANADEAIKAQPDNLELRVRLAETLLTAGHTKDGLRWIDEVLAAAPTYPPAHRVLAAHYERNGQPDKAAEHRKRAGP